MVAGYARQMAVGPAVAVVRQFHAAGGSPDAPMLDILANIAIRSGDYKVAMQVGGAGRQMGRSAELARRMHVPSLLNLAGRDRAAPHRPPCFRLCALWS